MQKSIYTLVIAVCLLACQNAADNSNQEKNGAEKNKAETAQDSSAGQKQTKDEISGCYMRVLQRDTLAAYLNQTGNTITGRLTFDNFEKDGSTGSVEGTIENSIVKLIYTFQSEGMTSKREIYFRHVSDGIILGIGEMADKSDMSVFTNPSTIKYEEGEKWQTIDCAILPSKYK